MCANPFIHYVISSLKKMSAPMRHFGPGFYNPCTGLIMLQGTGSQIVELCHCLGGINYLWYPHGQDSHPGETLWSTWFLQMLYTASLLSRNTLYGMIVKIIQRYVSHTMYYTVYKMCRMYTVYIPQTKD